MITIVSGLPRSGTSLMMQMLAAGGLPILTDQQRKPDADNPRGYYEWEPVKLLPSQPNLIDKAEGKVVKVITQLLMSIPEGRQYKVIFMERPLAEVLASQDEMLRRRGKSDTISHDIMAEAFRDHLAEVDLWLNQRTDLSLRRQPYPDLLRDPRGCSEEISQFLGIPLNLDAMAGEVDTSLYRNRHA